MPNVDLILGADPGRKRPVRTEPAQRRSSERLDALLDAAADIVDECGVERLTTQMVAERGGASIGTVYRYFPDRVAVVHALRERAVVRFRERVASDLDALSAASNWWTVVEVALDAYAALARDEPGFIVVWASERELGRDDLEPEFAHRVAQLLEAEFAVEGDGSELRFRIGIAMEIGDALINRAYMRDPAGDERYLAEAKRIVRVYLAEHLDLDSGASTAA